jgi:hypothetical protein
MTPRPMVVSVRDSTGPLDSPWGNDLRKIEERIKDVESTGIKARWESGRHLIALRKGKQLPKGVLDEAAGALGVSRTELTKRMKLYDRFPSEIEVRNAITKFPSWYSMVKDGLTVKKREKKPPVPAEVAEFRKQTRKTISMYRTLNYDDLATRDIESLEDLRAEIDRILAQE